MNRSQNFLLSGVIIISIMAPAASIITLLSVSPASASPGGLVPRDPILIDGDAGFTPANGVTSGSGTVDDPYIIEGWDISAENYSGIMIRNTTAHFVIRNSYVHAEGTKYRHGILFSRVKNGRIDNVTSENSLDGISLLYSDNNVIANSTVESNSWGISLHDFSSNNIIENITASNNSYGISLTNSLNNIIENITASNNSSGGIYLYYRSSNNIIKNNTAENNTYGIRLLGSDNNRIYHNILINNANQAHDNGTNYWDDGYPSGGNYWSDYTGADNFRGENQDIAGSDGIGDTPYNIPTGTNQDSYPLMNPASAVTKPSPVRWPLIAGIVGAIVIICVAFAFYMRRR